MAVFPPEYAAALVSFTLLPLMQRIFPPIAPKPALHRSSTTGNRVADDELLRSVHAAASVYLWKLLRS